MNLRRVQTGSFSLKALLVALAVGLLFGAFSVGEPLENALKLGRYKLREHAASAEVVVVTIDDRSLAELGPAPWSGSRLAELLKRVDGARARRIHLDAELPDSGSPEAVVLEAAMSELRAELTLPARFSIDSVTGTRQPRVPAARFANHATLVNTNLLVWWDDVVWRQPYGAEVGGRVIPSLSAILSERGVVS